jgi:hypothetical protein
VDVVVDPDDPTKITFIYSDGSNNTVDMSGAAA